jgi:hypothetical protein
LREPDDFKRLHIEAVDGLSVDSVRGALASIATFEENNFWIDVASLQAMGRAGDVTWEQNFAAMIASVQKFGWLSPDRQRVRCHLKTK